MRCIARNVIAICSFKSRDSSQPNFVALVPHIEMAEHDGAGVPKGFLVIQKVNQKKEITKLKISVTCYSLVSVFGSCYFFQTIFITGTPSHFLFFNFFDVVIYKQISFTRGYFTRLWRRNSNMVLENVDGHNFSLFSHILFLFQKCAMANYFYKNVAFIIWDLRLLNKLLTFSVSFYFRSFTCPFMTTSATCLRSTSFQPTVTSCNWQSKSLSKSMQSCHQ
jgi:hypothetical protein